MKNGKLSHTALQLGLGGPQRTPPLQVPPLPVLTDSLTVHDTGPPHGHTIHIHTDDSPLTLCPQWIRGPYGRFVSRAAH